MISNEAWDKQQLEKRIKELEADLEWTYDIIGDLPREWRKLFEAAYEKEVSDE